MVRPRVAVSRLQRGRVLVAIAGGVVAVGVGVGVLLLGLVNLRSSAETTLRTSTLLEQVIQVEGSVVDAETGLRGYVITAAPVFLAPLRKAARVLPDETGALARTVNRDHNDATAAGNLSAAALSYLTTYVPHVLALVRTNPRAARSLAITLAGKHRVDAIRSQAGALGRNLSAQQASRQRSSTATANDDITFGVIVLVGLVLLTIIIEGGFGRLLLSRERALSRSRETERMLQTSLLPLTIPDIPACDLAIRFTAAGVGDLVGGDFYDAFELDTPDRWAIVVGDVCGKGAEAAATTAVARWTLRSASLLTATPTDALRHLNEVLLRRHQRSLFATITYMLLDIGAHGVRVTVACAGHPPPIVLISGQVPDRATARGDLLGVWPQVRLLTSEVYLARGDLVVAYTDGATDFSSEPIDPLEVFLRGADTTSAHSVAAAIEARALAGRPSPRDDIAVVAIRFNGATARAAGSADAPITSTKQRRPRPDLRHSRATDRVRPPAAS